MRRVAIPLIAVVCLSACAPKSRPLRSDPGHPSGTGPAAAALARSLIGTPYRNGGTDPEGFDCSGLVQYVFGELGVALPRAVRDQAAAGQRVDRAGLRDGDLVFFAIDGRTISHAGIMVGPDSFVHAPSSRGRVREESLNLAYWQSRFAAARRVVLPLR